MMAYYSTLSSGLHPKNVKKKKEFCNKYILPGAIRQKHWRQKSRNKQGMSASSKQLTEF